MQIFVKIGEKILADGTKEDEILTMCLCQFSWGQNHTSVTCHEFLEAVRYAYIYHIEMKKKEQSNTAQAS